MLHAGSEIADDWKNDWLLQEIKHDLCDIHNVNETGLCLSVQPSNSVNSWGNPCHAGTKSKQHVTVLLARDANGTGKLPPTVRGRDISPWYFKNVKKKNFPQNVMPIQIPGYQL